MKSLYFTILLFLVNTNVFAQTSNREVTNKPTIAILGTFHFAGSTSDAASMKVDDMKSEKRQQEILNLVELLAEYQPTKIILEHPYSSKKLDSLYNLYTQGKHSLYIGESQQVGFRLAKKLNHSNVYAADVKMNLPFEQLTSFLEKEGKMEQMQHMMGSLMSYMEVMQNKYDNGTISDFLAYMNTDEMDALNKNLYLEYINKMGSAKSPVGSEVVSIWWHRNFKIMRNIDEIAQPNDRILVIFGQGHTAIFKDFYKTRSDYNYKDINSYLQN